MLSSEDINIIELWLENQLDSERIEILENKLKSNPEWAESVRIYKDLRSAFRHPENNKSKINQSVIKVWKSNKKRWYILLFLLILILLLYLYLSNSNKIEYQKANQPDFTANNKDTLANSLLYDSATLKSADKDLSLLDKSEKLRDIAILSVFDPIRFAKLKSNEAGILDSFTTELHKDYLNKKYRLVIDKVDKIDNTGKGISDFLLLKGLASFKMGEYKHAEQIFNELIISKQYALDPLQWNILLCRILNNDLDSAKLMMKLISNDKDHPYYQKTLELINYMPNY